MITREIVAEKIRDYLHHRLALSDLVDWAEIQMMEGNFDEIHHDAICNTVARLGVADVRSFGLTWEDCERLLDTLGYVIKVDIVSR